MERNLRRRAFSRVLQGFTSSDSDESQTFIPLISLQFSRSQPKDFGTLLARDDPFCYGSGVQTAKNCVFCR